MDGLLTLKTWAFASIISPVRLMDTLVVLLTLGDDDLFWNREAASGKFDDDDDQIWTKERHDSGD
jgi:hypothetical protein